MRNKMRNLIKNMIGIGALLAVGTITALIMKDSDSRTEVHAKPAYYFHGIDTLSDGRLIGKLGAAKFLLDSTGAPVSKGFHEITPFTGYKARNGNCEYELASTGEVIRTYDEDCELSERDAYPLEALKDVEKTREEDLKRGSEEAYWERRSQMKAKGDEE